MVTFLSIRQDEDKTFIFTDLYAITLPLKFHFPLATIIEAVISLLENACAICTSFFANKRCKMLFDLHPEVLACIQ